MSVKGEKKGKEVFHPETEDEIKELFTIAKSENKFVLIDFYADWCGPCLKLSPFVNKWSDKYENVIFSKVNVDLEDLQDYINKYSITSIPRVLIFDKNENIQGDFKGFNPDKIESGIKGLNK